ncbi:hypothetical protein Pars_1156 [Pyrobaculum arsenaticum DSM 13514]|uniref:Uncharacterized protein n=1 Tax=Pyrobaculum arsenaticum (strain DSM 13514 / JCM 11321 / PZ6) TaxID=340102 RepID=A4WK11_PYRAR|nr:hypothetical protein Pars_1156 [Pyrobaculum arsenaticum DSM 13514]
MRRPRTRSPAPSAWAQRLAGDPATALAAGSTHRGLLTCRHSNMHGNSPHQLFLYPHEFYVPLTAEGGRRFLQALEEDAEFRYAVAGLLGLGEVLADLKMLRKDFNKFAEESLRRWEENNMRWEENNKRWEENEKRSEDNWRRWEKNERR